VRLVDAESLHGVPRVLDSGKVSVMFRWRFRHGNAYHDYTCGSWPGKSLAEIRRVRDEAERVVATGVNPNDEKKTRRAVAQQAVIDERLAIEAEQARIKAELEAKRTVNTTFDTWVTNELHNRVDAGAEVRRAWAKDVARHRRNGSQRRDRY